MHFNTLECSNDREHTVIKPILSQIQVLFYFILVISHLLIFALFLCCILHCKKVNPSVNSDIILLQISTTLTKFYPPQRASQVENHLQLKKTCCQFLLLRETPDAWQACSPSQHSGCSMKCAAWKREHEELLLASIWFLMPQC